MSSIMVEKHPSSALWLYGKHACFAALQNPKRKCHELLLLQQSQDKYATQLPSSVRVTITDKHNLEKKLPHDAVHQGIALRVDPLPPFSLQDPSLHGPLVMLDQVTDPHNIGAILRTCAAFNAGGIIVTKQHCPNESGVMAKSACGALELVPVIRVSNLDQAIRSLQDTGFWCYGLTGGASSPISTAKFDAKTLFVFGSEGSGLRNLTAKRCDHLINVPIDPQMESLNVSNAVAITLYEYAKRL
jgi:23S rRNA (guanosine2251-2'-O)-methyltransferase